MPENLFLLLPLLGGYLFTRHWNRTKWYAARWEKEHLLLNSTMYGLIFSGAAYFLINLQDYLPCIGWLPCLPRWPMHIEGVNYLGFAFLGFVLGLVAIWPANYIWKVTKQFEKFIENEGTLLDKLANESMKSGKTVMLTLKSGKVYAGFVLSAPSPGASRPMIGILPTTSGYRDRKSHRVVFTTNYSQALEEITEDCTALVDEAREKLMAAMQLRKELERQKDLQKEADMADLQEESNNCSLRCDQLLSAVDDFGILIPVEEIASMTLYHAWIHTKYFLKVDKPATR